MSLLLTVDWRESEGAFGESALHTRLLMQRIEDQGESVELVNINSTEEILRRNLTGSVVIVQADSPPYSACLPVRYRSPHGFRLWLESNNLKYVGSSYKAIRRSSTYSKPTCRKVLHSNGILVPKGMLIGSSVRSVVRRLGLPLVSKQARATGCGVGVHFVTSVEMLGEVAEWHAATRKTKALAEQFIDGREFTVWVVDRGGTPEAYGIIEFSKPGNARLLDQGAKLRMRAVESFTDQSRYWPEARFSPEVSADLRAQLEQTAVRAHIACGLRHYSRTDMIATEKGPFVLDVNGSPQLDNWLDGVSAVRGESILNILQRLVKGAACRP